MKKPTLRFKEFDGEWDGVPFDKGMTFLSNNSLSRADLNNVAGDVQNVHYGDVLVKFGEVLDLTKEELPFINAGFELSKLSSSMLTDGDIVIADTAEDETAGKCTEIRNVENNKVLAGLHTMPCRPNAKYASGYLGYYMNSPAYHNQLLKYMQGTKVVSISKSALGNTVLAYPSDVTEQKAIGSFFAKLDSLIEGKRVKLDKLKKLKLAYLGKMFPKNGSRVPEVRFKGFSGDWEESAVSTLLEERVELSPKSVEFPLMAFIAHVGVAPKGDRYDRESLVNDSVGKLYKRTRMGDFIYSSNNLETGSIGLNKYGDATISPVYSIFRTTDAADSNFIGMALTRKDFIHEMVKWRQGVIYGQWRIHESDFLRIHVLAPSVAEQRKIGAFFQNLDNLINLQQQELDKLSNIKSACLSKMFA